MKWKTKYCPDLTTRQAYFANEMGIGNCTSTVLRECLREQCAAYDRGECLKYKTNIDYPVKEDRQNEK